MSVVIATRERPALLRRAIRSVLSQAYPGTVECLVVFDQSPAFDLGDVAPRDGGDRSLRVMSNDRTPGLAGARNTGAERGFGEVLAFCDDDDEWLPGKLVHQLAALEASGADVAVTGIEVVAGERRIARVCAHERVTPGVLLRSRATEIHPSTVVVRRRAFETTIGPIDEAIPGSYGEDYEWLLRAVAVGDITAVRKPFVRVYRSGDSFFTARWQTIADAIVYLTAKHPEVLVDRRNAARLYGRLAFAQAALGRPSDARGWAWRSIRRRPLERRPYLALAVSARLVRPETVEAWANRSGRGV
ncbi:MAG: glycosyltransferase family 2 protein [Actinomycetota bacterium]